MLYALRALTEKAELVGIDACFAACWKQLTLALPCTQVRPTGAYMAEFPTTAQTAAMLLASLELG